MPSLYHLRHHLYSSFIHHWELFIWLALKRAHRKDVIFNLDTFDYEQRAGNDSYNQKSGFVSCSHLFQGRDWDRQTLHCIIARMIKFVIASVLLLQTKVEGQELGPEIDLLCPEGWLASGLFHLTENTSAGVKNVSTCLTCRSNPLVSHRFAFIDICLSAPLFNTKRGSLSLTSSQCKDKACNDLNQKPYCGVRLKTFDSKIRHEFKVCEDYGLKSNHEGQSVELICPRSFNFTSVLRIKYPSAMSSICILCESKSSKQLHITMCSSLAILGEGSFLVDFFKMPECENRSTDNNSCRPGSVPPIGKGLNCGTKLLSSTDGRSVNVSNYIRCSDLKTTNQVWAYF